MMGEDTDAEKVEVLDDVKAEPIAKPCSHGGHTGPYVDRKNKGKKAGVDLVCDACGAVVQENYKQPTE